MSWWTIAAVFLLIDTLLNSLPLLWDAFDSLLLGLL